MPGVCPATSGLSLHVLNLYFFFLFFLHSQYLLHQSRSSAPGIPLCHIHLLSPLQHSPSLSILGWCLTVWPLSQVFQIPAYIHIVYFGQPPRLIYLVFVIFHLHNLSFLTPISYSPSPQHLNLLFYFTVS